MTISPIRFAHRFASLYSASSKWARPRRPRTKAESLCGGATASSSCTALRQSYFQSSLAAAPSCRISRISPSADAFWMESACAPRHAWLTTGKFCFKERKIDRGSIQGGFVTNLNTVLTKFESEK